MTDTITQLADFFVRFPGIGKRQAKRFVYFLLSQDIQTTNEFVGLLEALKRDIVQCDMCARFFVGKETQSSTCSLCAHAHRDHTTLMLVEKDIDLENIEQSGAYNGHYFVLGGTVPILEEKPADHVRSTALLKRMKQDAFDEIILAMSATPEGENTAQYVRKLLKDFSGTISLLGRGLSTGTELEYSDAETIKNALSGRA